MGSSGACAVAGKAVARSSRTYPLRRIVGVVDERVGSCDLPRELLECGHVVPVKQDIYGPTNAIRRRCRRCHIDNLLKAEKGSDDP